MMSTLVTIPLNPLPVRFPGDTAIKMHCTVLYDKLILENASPIHKTFRTVILRNDYFKECLF